MSRPGAFACTSCGLCCRHVDRHEWYRHLDRGDGVCRNLTEPDNLCAIYQTRPIQCRIDILYDRYYSTRMSRAAYYAMTTEACARLVEEHSRNAAS